MYHIYGPLAPLKLVVELISEPVQEFEGDLVYFDFSDFHIGDFLVEGVGLQMELQERYTAESPADYFSPAALRIRKAYLGVHGIGGGSMGQVLKSLG